LGECDTLELEQKKGRCRYPGGTYYVEKDDGELYIATAKQGKFKITSKRIAASIKPDTHGIYNIKKNNRGTYISTDKIGDFYLEPETISKEEGRKRARQKAEWDEMEKESVLRDKRATMYRDSIKIAEEEAKAKAQEEGLEDAEDVERKVVIVSENESPRYRGYYGYWSPTYPCHYNKKKPCYPHYPNRHGDWKPHHPRSQRRIFSPESFRNFSIR